MPKREFAWAKGQPASIEVEWSGAWNNVVVRMNSQPLGTFANQSELEEGKDFVLVDGSILTVRLRTMFSQARLAVLRNGTQLPAAGQKNVLAGIEATYPILFLMGAGDVALGIASYVSEEVARRVLGWPTIVLGVVYGLLGLLVWRRRSLIALGIGIGLLSLDTLMLVVNMIAASQFSLYILAIRALMIFGMVNGFKTLRRERRAERVVPSVAAFD